MAVAKKKEVTPRLVLWMKLAIALTFACHGLYSLGYYPRPGSFVSMTMRTLFFSEPQSIGFLKLVGLLDFVVAVGIFLPGRWSRHFLLYAAIWGLATSLARITGNFYAAYFVSSLHQWVHEAVFRLPHALVPLAVYTLERAVRPSPTNIKSTGSPIA